MSRIQDILAKAERDGTARRSQPAGGFAAHAAPAAAPRVDGTAALDTVLSEALPLAGPSDAAVADSRAAMPTLHPLLVAAIDPHSVAAEQYRTLRARINHREETAPLRTLMITSPGAAEGKSITAANLAITMAQEFQRRVVIVDADLRGSAIHALFGLPGEPGLAEVLGGEAALDDVLLHMPDYRLSVVPAGRTPQFPTELLGSAAMRRVVDTLRARYDRVLFDLPATMPLADAGTLAPLADGVLMVVRAGATLRPALDEALGVFDEEKVIGVVLNETT